MCGLHGIITTNERITNADDFISDGFVAGSLRGTDASGIAAIDMVQGVMDYQKLPVQGSFFINDKHARGLMLAAGSNYQITMCHTRSTTSGPSGMNAAHPFVVEGDSEVDGGNRILVGCHNGTFSNWTSKEDGKKFTVDSEWALNRIFKKGMDAFKEFNGPFCFTFWDSDNQNVLNIALNDDRPMFVAFLESGGMAYASELGMLWWLLERNKIKLKGQILKLIGKHWYKFNGDTPETLQSWTKEKLPDVELSSASTAAYSHYANGNGYNYHTVVSKVDALLSRISNSSHQALVAMTQASNATGSAKEDVAELTLVDDHTPAKASRRVSTTVDEIKMARECGVMSLEGDFEPANLDETTGELGGYFRSKDRDHEFLAVIRNGVELEKKAHTYSVWGVRLIGMVDNGKELIAVCSQPIHYGLDEEAIREDAAYTTH